MSIEHFIENYGYWAVLLGAMIEGESVILTASALAGMGRMSIGMIALITFWGTLIADQGIFILGRIKGPRLLHRLQHRWPNTTPHIHKALSFLKRNETIYIMSFRFIYGIRILSPFVLGTQGVSFSRFAALNAVSALLWTGVSCAAGYALGSLAEQYTNNINLVILGTIGLVVGASILIGHLKLRGKMGKKATPESQASQPLSAEPSKNSKDDQD
jgi:membrane protein DedA with SNARE-associated domain